MKFKIRFLTPCGMWCSSYRVNDVGMMLSNNQDFFSGLGNYFLLPFMVPPCCCNGSCNVGNMPFSIQLELRS